MSVNGGPNMLDMLSLLGGAQAGPGAGADRSGLSALSALAPLLQGLNGAGGGGPDLGSLAALAPLLQSLAGPGAGKSGSGKAAEAAEARDGAEAAAAPVIDVEPRPAAADEQTPPGPQQPPSSGETPGGRGSRRRARGISFDPALLSLLAGLGGSVRPQQREGPLPEERPDTAGQRPEEDFDPCADCPLDCPRRNPSLSFGQVQALAATFPAYV